MKIQTILTVIISLCLVLAVLFFLPWHLVTWGTVQLKPSETITVSGEAHTLIKNQIATFTAGVSFVSDNKDEAVSKVNSGVVQIVDALKTFGIPEADIKTQNLNIYQMEEQYYEDGRQKTRPGQWRIGNDIEIKLRNIEKANELGDLLSKSGATNVYGPNFMMDDTSDLGSSLLTEAVANAFKKASQIASGNGKKIGTMLSISEGTVSNVSPYKFGAQGQGGGGGDSILPGQGTVSQSVTVTYELK